MASTTGTAIVQGAFALLNVFTPGESVSANDGEYARTVLNDLLSSWGQRTLFIPVIARERFDMTVGKGSPTNPYTIGSGGDFDTERPANQNAITAANLILTSTSPEVRIPLGIYTDQAYDANQIPTQTNTYPTGLYYSPTYASGLGSIFLWPVPNTATNDLELFLQTRVAPFANLSTTYYVPDGVPLMLKYNLADALQGAYGKQMSESDRRLAVSSMATFKRSNSKTSDLANDAAGLFGSRRHGVYNIYSDTGG